MSHILKRNGLNPDKSQILAIKKISRNVTDLQRFLWLVTYLAKFITTLSGHCEVSRNSLK